MSRSRRFRWIVATALVVLFVAFLAFRPDKLFVDDTVDESLAEAFETPATATTTSTTVAATTTNEEREAEAEAPTTSTVASTTAPSGPTAITTGQFLGIDHSAEGTSTVYEQDGRYVLRFEDDTDIQNGPDLYVWVLPSDEYTGGTPPAYIDLGKIKGNVGGQNYELPAEFDPEIHKTVLIWCLRFSTPFAAAPLT